MALFYTSLYAFCTVFIILIGTVPCKSQECTMDGLRKCDDVYEGGGMCRWFIEIKTCLEKIDKNCTDDKVAERITQSLAMAHARAEQCTGHSDFQCFHTALHACEEKAPFWQKYQIQHKESGRKSYCGSFKSKVPDAKACVKDLTKDCILDSQRALIDDSVKALEALERLCAEY